MSEKIFVVACRLCRGTKSLFSLFELEDDQSLHEKIEFCVDLKVKVNDGLPSMICKTCKKRIMKFYTFKRNCLRVNLELRNSYSEVIIKTNDTDCINEFPEDPDFSQDSPKNIKLSDINFDGKFYVKEEMSQTSIQCELCGSIYNSKTEYQQHLSSHREAKRYECDFCPKHFTRAESKNIHMRTHFGIRPFICEFCGQSSTKRQDLIRHMKIHSNDRNHECYTCGRRFKRSMDLHTHSRTHTGARPYKCSICNKDYTSHSGLRKHIKNHQRNEPDTIS